VARSSAPWATAGTRRPTGNRAEAGIQCPSCLGNLQCGLSYRWTSNTTGLTGLLTRRAFEAVLHAHMADVRRHGDRGALLVLDLDRLSRFNVSHGPAVVDQVMARVGRILSRQLNESDVAARTGVDEFAVLLVEANVDRARLIAEILVLEAGAELAMPDLADPLRVTTGLGACALTPVQGASAKAIADAETAMCEAKRANGNGYSLRGFTEHGDI
jgi:diguanylate cyclase (GGDEF)-like protein